MTFAYEFKAVKEKLAAGLELTEREKFVRSAIEVAGREKRKIEHASRPVFEKLKIFIQPLFMRWQTARAS